MADGLIYVTSDKLYAIDETGRTRWSFDPGEHGFISDPVLQGNDVVFAYRRGPEVRVVAIDRTTRGRSWTWSATTRNPWGLWLNVDGDEILVVAGSLGPNIWLIQLGGREVWRAQAHRRPEAFPGSVPSAMGDGVVAVITYPILEVRSRTDGSLLWTKGRGEHRSPVVARGMVLTTSERGHFHLNAYEAHSGRRIERIRGVSEFAVRGDRLWAWRQERFGDDRGTPARLEVYRIPALTRVWSVAAAEDWGWFAWQLVPTGSGVFILESLSSRYFLSYIDAREGRLWERFLPEVESNSPFVGSSPRTISTTGGAILVSTELGILYAYAPVIPGG